MVGQPPNKRARTSKSNPPASQQQYHQQQQQQLEQQEQQQQLNHVSDIMTNIVQSLQSHQSSAAAQQDPTPNLNQPSQHQQYPVQSGDSGISVDQRPQVPIAPRGQQQHASMYVY
jgi:hypothetical protein